MRVYLPDPAEYFAWLDQQGYAYVVLRGFLPFAQEFPGAGSRHDIDMLADDAALAAIAQKYGRFGKAQGAPCDVYGATTPSEGHYRKRAYYPPVLARALLDGRRLWRGLFYAPDALHHMLALAYHRLYRKKYPRSGALCAYETIAFGGLYAEEMAAMAAEAGVACPRTMWELEAFLHRHGHALDYADMAAVLQDFAGEGYRSHFLALRCARLAGEVTLSLPGTARARDRIVQEQQVIFCQPLSWAGKLAGLLRAPALARVFFGQRRRRAVWCWLRARAVVVVYDLAPAFSDARDHFSFYLHDGACPGSVNEAEALSLLPLCLTGQDSDEVIRQIVALRTKNTNK